MPGDSGFTFIYFNSNNHPLLCWLQKSPTLDLPSIQNHPHYKKYCKNRQLCWAMSRQERPKECFRADRSFRWKQRSFWGSVGRRKMKNISCNVPTTCFSCEALGFNFASDTATQAPKRCDSATDSLENKPYKPQILWQYTWSLGFLKLYPGRKELRESRT